MRQGKGKRSHIPEDKVDGALLLLPRQGDAGHGPGRRRGGGAGARRVGADVEAGRAEGGVHAQRDRQVVDVNGAEELGRLLGGSGGGSVHRPGVEAHLLLHRRRRRHGQRQAGGLEGLPDQKVLLEQRGRLLLREGDEVAQLRDVNLELLDVVCLALAVLDLRAAHLRASQLGLVLVRLGLLGGVCGCFGWLVSMLGDSGERRLGEERHWM